MGALAAGAAALGWVGAVDPGVPGRYPVCPLFHATGLLCPGCGGLRGVHALAQGDPAAAFGANALAVLAVAAAAVVWGIWAVRALRAAAGPVRAAGPTRAAGATPSGSAGPSGRSAWGTTPVSPAGPMDSADPTTPAAPRRTARTVRTARSRLPWWAAGALVTGFTVVRNLPFGAGLAP